MPIDNPLQTTAIFNAMAVPLRSSINQLTILDCIDSTNTWLMNNGDCYDICLAEQQSAGRGRGDNQWISPTGENIYLSLRWCFNDLSHPVTRLSLHIGLLVADVLAKWGVSQHGVKWPNDIYWQGKKLAGILIEHVYKQDHFIIGLGLNVNMLSNNDKIGQPWCSLRQILGQPIDRNLFLGDLLSHLIQGLQQFPTISATIWQTHWQRWDLLASKSIHLQYLDKTYQGIVCGVDAQGQLLLMVDNKLHAFLSADIYVTW